MTTLYEQRRARAVKMLCHDPRISDDREHRVETTNIELHARELMRQKYPALVIDWEAVKAEANACEGRFICGPDPKE